MVRSIPLRSTIVPDGVEAECGTYAYLKNSLMQTRRYVQVLGVSTRIRKKGTVTIKGHVHVVADYRLELNPTGWNGSRLEPHSLATLFWMWTGRHVSYPGYQLR